jgi:Arc/MetJ family transcription regulator
MSSNHRYILMHMTKRLVDLDDGLLVSAQAALGTSNMSETIREALRRAVSIDPGEEYVAAFTALSIADPDAERADAWHRADNL